MKKPKKILFVSDSGDNRGAQKALVELMLILRKDYGITPILLTKKKNRLNQLCEREGIENYSFWYRYIMLSSPYNIKMINYVKHVVGMINYIIGYFAKYKINYLGIDFSDIDIIHTNTNRVDLGVYIKQKYKIPHIIHVREYGIEDFGNVIYRIKPYNYLNKYTDRFLMISKGVREAWISRGLEREKARLVYDGISLEKYPCSRQPSDNDTVFKIAVAGAINKFKGQMQVIEAVNLLPEDVKKRMEIYFFGNGKFDYIKQMKTKISDYGLEKQVHFEGYVNHLPARLSECSVGITPSKAEGFGLVTVEYILSGLTVIASNTGANVEIIKNKKTGILYPYGDCRKLAEQIQYLYENKKESYTLWQNAMEDVKANFTTKINAEKIYHVYLEILNNQEN